MSIEGKKQFYYFHIQSVEKNNGNQDTISIFIYIWFDVDKWSNSTRSFHDNRKLSCNDIASLGLMLTSIIYLVCYALIAAFCGIASSWIGFRKQSVIATIVASCIIMVTMCQIVAMTFFSGVAMILLLAGMGIITFLAVESMLSQARKMEI